MNRLSMALALISCAAFSLSSDAKMVSSSPVEVVQTMFDSLAAGDLETYNNSVTSDFFLYDLGERLSKADFFNGIQKAKAKGLKAKWLVTKPEVHISGDFAWIAYVNQGVFDINGKPTDKTWLESAVLQHDKIWRVRFLHSTAAKTQGR